MINNEPALPRITNHLVGIVQTCCNTPNLFWPTKRLNSTLSKESRRL
jgi:hypothetical protein